MLALTYGAPNPGSLVEIISGTGLAANKRGLYFVSSSSWWGQTFLSDGSGTAVDLGTASDVVCKIIYADDYKYSIQTNGFSMFIEK